MDDLVLTLGHGSSAILIRDGELIAGYEEERLSGIKSDSHFPIQAIEELNRRFTIKKPTLFVSHWELFGEVDKMNKKHWDPKYIESTFGGVTSIFSSTDEFTHHDAHAWSGILFAEPFPDKALDRTYIFVMDGFGTFGEHMSFYRYVDGIPILISRKFGFGTSLGLLYQYTTAYLGMKQNQDEYKLLAFETHIDEVIPKINYKMLQENIGVFSELYITKLASFTTASRTDPLLNVGALPVFATEVANMLSMVLKTIEIPGKDLSERERKIVISFFTQAVVELVVLYFVREYNPTNLILVGGLFYNVKLNSMISKCIAGKTCIMPLAGDQGAGLGIYKAMHSGFNWPGHLFWGPRDLSHESLGGIDNLIYDGSSEYKAFAWISEFIHDGRIVNIVRGNMEFGPRALCHTSSLALPDPKIAEKINRINNRVNEMPFAPVMTKELAYEFLDDTGKIHKSLEYMICTRDVTSDMVKYLMGASHKSGDVYTARPQVTNDPMMTKLIDDNGPLINTSFNYHGVPIVWNAQQIRHTHMMEQSQHVAKDEKPAITVVIGE